MFGVILVVVALAVLAFALLQHMKGKRILAAPFKKTGELAKNPTSEDPKGAISTEGAVIPPTQQVFAPCSKTPCLYYEVKVERIWEKTETTQDGTKTTKGTTTLDTVKGGAVCALDDGTGAITVDFSKGADFDNMKEGYKKELNGRSWSSNVQFGEFHFEVPVIGSGDGYTIGFKATEKYVPVEGNLFVLGRIEGSSIVKPGWRSMMASSKGRDGLLSSTAKKKKFGFIGGGVSALLSIPAFIFGPQGGGKSSYCESALNDVQVRCKHNVSNVSGDDFTWTVTKAGKYDVTVFAPAKKISLAPQLTVTGADGKKFANAAAAPGGNALATVEVEPGTYTVSVKPFDGNMVKGGFDYDLEIASLGGAAPAAPTADMAAPAEGEKKVDVAAAPADAPPEAAKPAPPPPAAPTKAAKKGKKGKK
jgi:hypothetical protein